MRLYLVLGEDAGAGRDPFEVARAAVAGGVGAIQVRLKDRTPDAVVDFAIRVRAAIGDDALLIVNDDVRAALRAGADGVHVGQDDAPIEAIRAIAGERLSIGVSTHSVEQALDAKARRADAIGIGAMFGTQTKAETTLIGPGVLDGLAIALGGLPFFPIGGITVANVGELTRRGVGRAAVSRAITHADDPAAAAALLLELLSAAPL